MINDIICGVCGSHDFKPIDGKNTCQGCGCILTEKDNEKILNSSYQAFKNEAEVQKMLDEGKEPEEIADELGMDGCVNDYGMEQYVTNCHEDADCYNCWIDCITKKYFQ